MIIKKTEGTVNEFDPIAYINEPRWQESRYGLERIGELLERMGHPQDRLKFVHVAGTNGKGSTCAFIEAALREAGYKTGLFTSPYIITFEERIRVNGQNISLDDLRDVTLFVREHAEAMAAASGEHPTEFELMTAVAFEHFARSGCDIVIAEVGMGGRLDSTNIIEAPEACVIVRLGLDHTEFLGDTLEAIAHEKAGIIKPGAAVISWPQDDEAAMRVIAETARDAGSDVIVPDFSQLALEPIEGVLRPFTYKGQRYQTRLLGSYQPSNAALALEVLAALQTRGWNIADDDIVCGIAATVWPARFEVVEVGPPAVIVDGGHNPQGAVVLAESLRDVFADERIVFLMSVLADKDYEAMIRQVVPLACGFACSTPPNPRALQAEDLAEAIRAAIREGAENDAGGAVVAKANHDAGTDHEIPVIACESFEQALEQARELAGTEHPICVFGSLYSVGEVKRLLSR